MDSKLYDELLDEERKHQLKKCGVQQHNDFFWYAILAEEFGEVAKSMLEGKHKDVEMELIQCAAVIKAWLTQPTDKMEERNV